MVRSHTKSPKSSLGRSLSRVRVRSPSLRCKTTSDSIERDQRIEFLGSGNQENGYLSNYGDGNGNKVMVVVDASIEAKGALEWALSHTIQSQDTIVLLCVGKDCKQGKKTDEKHKRVTELLHSMRNMCQKRKPGVQVEAIMLEGKEKGPMIVEEAKQQNVSLLVVGQRKRSIMRRLMKRWGGKRGRGGGVVDFCIQNASCMTIAVRRKSSTVGGYLITTKRHKNFWLLA